MWDSHGIFFLRKKSKIISLSLNFISWRRTKICWTLFHFPALTSYGKVGDIFRRWSRCLCSGAEITNNFIALNYISWQLKSSTENLTFQKGWFSRSANTMNQHFDLSYHWRNKALCNWREINHTMSKKRC